MNDWKEVVDRIGRATYTATYTQNNCLHYVKAEKSWIVKGHFIWVCSQVTLLSLSKITDHAEIDTYWTQS